MGLSLKEQFFNRFIDFSIFIGFVIKIMNQLINPFIFLFLNLLKTNKIAKHRAKNHGEHLSICLLDFDVIFQ